MIKRGKVYYRELFAGIIEESEEGFYFSYDSVYLKSEDAMPISLTLP